MKRLFQIDPHYTNRCVFPLESGTLCKVVLTADVNAVLKIAFLGHVNLLPSLDSIHLPANEDVVLKWQQHDVLNQEITLDVRAETEGNLVVHCVCSCAESVVNPSKEVT